MSVVCAYITASNRRWIDQFWNWHESEIPPSQFYFSKSCQEKLENVFCCCTNLELSTFEFRLALWFDFWKLLGFSRNWWNWKEFTRKKFSSHSLILIWYCSTIFDWTLFLYFIVIITKEKNNSYNEKH